MKNVNNGNTAIKNQTPDVCSPKEGQRKKKNVDIATSTNVNKRQQNVNISVLTCVCGRKFDTQEVLQKHQSKCKEFQTKQDKEVREGMKKAGLLGGEKNG